MNIQAIASNAVSTGVLQKSASSGNSSSSKNSTSYDVRDLNEDGYVSPEEEYIYELTHSTRTSSQNVSAQYTSQGNLNASSNGTSRFINLYA
jgi:hypothetical protein